MYDANGVNENASESSVEAAAESQPIVAVEPVVETVVEAPAEVVVAVEPVVETVAEVIAPVVVEAPAEVVAPVVEKRRAGRPKGSKNKPKAKPAKAKGKRKAKAKSKAKAKVVKVSKRKAKVAAEGRGRPNQFTAGEAKAFKAIVRKHGLVAGCELIAKKGGVMVNGKKHKLTISLPTLSRYVRMAGYGGKALTLHQGRPRKAA